MDSMEIQISGSMTDGSTTAITQDYALDFPPNTKYDLSENPSTDWEDITLYNTDEGIYLRNLRIENAKMGNQEWTQSLTERRVMWPDATATKINYNLVKVRSVTRDTSLLLDFEMNR